MMTRSENRTNQLEEKTRTQASSLRIWRHVKLLLLQPLHNHVHGALDTAKIFAHDLERVAAEFLAARAVTDQFRQRRLQRRRVADLHRGVLRHETSHHVGEVLHVWPEDHRLA